MKYKAFRNIVLVGVVAGGGVGIFFLAKGCKSEEKTIAQPQPSPTAAPVVRETAVAPPTPAAPASNLRDMDRAVLARIKQGITGDKVKDAIKSQSWKVNLYRDAGAPGVNRVKIDLDRDDKWDEKWTIEGESIKRQVSPSDDDKTYTEEYMLTANGWAAPGGEQTTTTTTTSASTTTTEGEPLRAFDRQIVDAINRPIAGDKVKDALPGAGVKVNLYKDAGQAAVNRLKIDLDGDEKWDEKWTIERDGAATEIKRQVAPNDDENYTVEYRLRAGAWKRKQP